MQAAKDTKRPRRTGIIAAILRIPAVQTILASLMCVLAGLLIGYIVLLFINPQGAGESIINVIKNFFTWKRPQQQLKQFGNTLAKTIPLIMCSLSILFSYKVGLFNIGTAGQYVAGACASLYAALAWGWSWLPCMLFALVAGALLGAIVGALKVYCNVNEVISGIMLNWIALYTTNTILTEVKEKASPYTMYFKDVNNKGALLPNLGLDKLFNNNSYVTIAVPLCLIFSAAVSLIITLLRGGMLFSAGSAAFFFSLFSTKILFSMSSDFSSAGFSIAAASILCTGWLLGLFSVASCGAASATVSFSFTGRASSFCSGLFASVGWGVSTLFSSAG